MIFWLLAVACASARQGSEKPSKTSVVEIPEPPASSTTTTAANEPKPAEAPVEPCTGDASAPLTADAIAAFNDARRAFAENRHADALDAFRKAYRLSCAERFLFLIGLELDANGDPEGALRVFRDYLERATSDIGQRRARAYIQCIGERRQGDAGKSCLQANVEAVPPE